MLSAGEPPASTAPPTTGWLRGRTADPLVQFVRYLFVGGAAFLVDFGTLALLHKLLGVHYLAAAAAGFTLGLLVNYAVSVRWVFDQRRVADRRVELGVYSLVGVVGLGLNHVTIWGFTAGLGLDPLLSKLVAAAVVLAWNFTARKVLLF